MSTFCKKFVFREVSFDAEYWLLFKTAVLDGLTSRVTSPVQLQLWQQFLMFVIAEVKDAFNSEISRKLSSGGTIPKSLPLNKKKVNTVPTRKVSLRHMEDERKKVNAGSSAPVNKKLRQELKEDLAHIIQCMVEEENDAQEIVLE